MFCSKLNVNYRFHSLEVALEEGDRVRDGFVVGKKILMHLVDNFHDELHAYEDKHGKISLDALDLTVKIVKEQTEVEKKLAEVEVPKQYRDGDPCPKCGEGRLRTDTEKRWLFCNRQPKGTCDHRVYPDKGAIIE